MRVLVNGQVGERVDPADRGLQYGDGLFETIAVVNGRPRFIEWHLERLDTGARRLGFPAPDLERFRSELAEAVDVPQAVVKLILTRGMGERGYRPPRDSRPTRIVAASAWPNWPASSWTAGVKLGWCRTRCGRNKALAGIKHLNRLEQVLARAEWDDGALDEGLMLDDGGHVISATQANLFARIEGRWVTPVLDECGVAGVMRRALRHWLEGQGEPASERAVTRDELHAASALVLTNALIGAWPVRELDSRQFGIDRQTVEFNAWLARQ
jgi:4-amino-4-deoxychorismate lyase